MKYIEIIEPVIRHEHGTFGRYSLFCPYCGYPLPIHVELYDGHFCYTAITKNHKDCHIIDEDYMYFYSKDPFADQAVKEWSVE